MDERLHQLLLELEQFGHTTDRATTDRRRRMLNITRDTGEFLSVLVRATRARRVLEIGTSNGYSTIWLASAAQAIGGTVTTVEASELKIKMASGNFQRAGLTSAIVQLHDDAGRALARMGDAAFEMIFLDSERGEYPSWWPDLKRILRPGGLLVADNATSHPDELAPFIALVEADRAFVTSVVPVGNGEFLATRATVEPGTTNRT